MPVSLRTPTQWAVFALLTVAQLMVVLDATVVNRARRACTQRVYHCRTAQQHATCYPGM